MDIPTIAKGLSEAQRNAILYTREEDGVPGRFHGYPGIGTIRVLRRLKLTDGYGLNEAGLAIRSYLMEKGE